MEKYGVKVDDEKVKTASADRRCPKCGKKLKTDTNVPVCDDHGTKPFETAGGPSRR